MMSNEQYVTSFEQYATSFKRNASIPSAMIIKQGCCYGQLVQEGKRMEQRMDGILEGEE